MLFAITRSIWGSTVFYVRVLVRVKLTLFGFLKHHGNKESKHKSFTYTVIISVPDNIENICDSCVKFIFSASHVRAKVVICATKWTRVKTLVAQC